MHKIVNNDQNKILVIAKSNAQSLRKTFLHSCLLKMSLSQPWSHSFEICQEHNTQKRISYSRLHRSIGRLRVFLTDDNSILKSTNKFIKMYILVFSTVIMAQSYSWAKKYNSRFGLFIESQYFQNVLAPQAAEI
ncbi:uncharacterized protein CELE_F31E3.6 [Caenorhabditis elegans]|uniref:Uncharacterized protein n=1 Tax=Caenorhabditis elegans TaxID=6239 RepID=Q19935_CAEEL|nr:Uncharacterized protein CELE_F31E3.6 [Caenorhabditis elegans]CCD63408.1 Uncharacterized protein CELE_F31E3.6 [Caenorhabditis elegans]|eukprot:NP_498526.1 Uncharacterized protein CELE_F31E3.6 [Caenorhabditis elegans]